VATTAIWKHSVFNFELGDHIAAPGLHSKPNVATEPLWKQLMVNACLSDHIAVLSSFSGPDAAKNRVVNKLLWKQ